MAQRSQRSSNGVTGEIKWLRLSGLALLAISIGLFGYFEDVVGERWLESPTVSNAIPAVIVFFIAGNVIAVGLALLLSGLQNLSLLDNQLARRAFLVRLAASNLMILCFLFVAVTDATGFDQQMDNDARFVVAGVVGYGLFLYAIRTSVMLYRSSWKYLVPSADEAMSRDQRPPVVYVRSFTSDDELHGVEGPLSRLYKGLHYTAAVSPEQELAWIMGRVGPVVAIGKPGERLPELGAARMYVSDENWREEITGLMSKAALVVVRAGDTANLWWELEQATARLPPQRIIMVAFGKKERTRDFRNRLAQKFGLPTTIANAPTPPVLLWLRRIMMPGRIQGSVFYFDSGGNAFERPITFSADWWSLVTNVISPHGAMLRAALEPVVDQAGVAPRRSSRSQTVAVFLALFGGIFGAHKFYLGHYRKGIWYCVFFWTAVPIFIGWVDAVRLALLDDAQFSRA